MTRDEALAWLGKRKWSVADYGPSHEIELELHDGNRWWKVTGKTLEQATAKLKATMEAA